MIKTFIDTAQTAAVDLKGMISNHPGFPKEGIVFRDFGPILADPQALAHVADEFGKKFDMAGVDILAGIESRGFIIATILGARYDKGMIMIRKPGKLPGSTKKRSYQLEYGHSSLEIQDESISRGQRVLICDDLLATGGTAKAAGQLVEDAGGVVAGFAFVIELAGLGGADAISGYDYGALVRYDDNE